MKHTITLNEESTYEAIGKTSGGNCEPIGDDQGNCFTSIKDAAEYAGVTSPYMWSHLQPDGPKTCRGHVYFYIRKRDQSFDKVMKQLAKTTAEVQRRKADEEDARKWREYQAKQEAIRKAEERRQNEIEKLKNRIAKTKERAEQYNAKWTAAVNEVYHLERELEELLDKE